MKKWYAVLRSEDDADWGYGSYSKKNAAKMVRTAPRAGDKESYIAVIDVTNGDE